MGAGVLVLINRLGALVLRRFTDTKERLHPISLDQVNLAALVGAVAGLPWGLAAGALSVLVNLISRRLVRLPEPLSYGLWAVALLLTTTSFTLIPTSVALAGSVMAAGAWALLGALYWWLHDLRKSEAAAEEELGDDDEPVAMGFGDVKLAAAMGAILGWEKFLVSLFLAVTLGALIGVVARIFGGSRLIPFGPYLLAGGLAALFFGDAMLAWYFGLLGV